MFFYNSNTKEKCSNSTKDKILESALTLFSTNGYFKTSVHDIQGHSGVSIGSIYNYFYGKPEIALELRAQILEQMKDAFADILSKQISFKDKYLSVLELLFVMTEEEPRTMNFILNSSTTEYLEDSGNIFESDAFNLFLSHLDSVLLNEFNVAKRKNKEFILSVFFGLPVQLIKLRLDGIIEDPLEKRIDQIINTILMGAIKEQ
jgi:AcrR family transcriptional regulator